MSRLLRPGWWLAVGCCALACGCSALGERESPRPVPLPPNVEPSDLFNTRPADGVVADARPFYRKDAPAVADAGGVVDPKRAAHEAAGDKTGTSEVGVKGLRAAERRQQEQNEQKAKADAARAERAAVEAKKALTPAARSLGGVVQSVIPLDRLAPALAPQLPTPESLAAETNRADEKVQQATAPPVKPGAKYDILVMSGGTAHGAYQAGVLCGWTDSGCRPRFDVVTGVSTGALVACAAFAGPDYDPELKRFYTTVRQGGMRGDIWKVKMVPPFGVGTDSIASNEPLRQLVRQVLHRPGYFETVAAEHARGRRLYVGTTNLDTERFVVWDMGAIASQGTPESRKLYEDILLTSAALPVLFTPSRLSVTVDGRRYEELHVDGGLTRSLFFYPPSDWPGEEEDKKTKYRMLAGARVYAILAGKVYTDPAGTDPKLVKIGFRSLDTLLNSLKRAELARIYSHCQDRDMEFKLAAIPADFLPLFPASTFDPEKMTALFMEGYNRVRNGQVWNVESPERAVSEDRARRGTDLTAMPANEIGPLAPVRTGGAPVVPLRVR